MKPSLSGGRGWSVTVSVIILRSHVMRAWAGWLGLVASALYFVNQGPIRAD